MKAPGYQSIAQTIRDRILSGQYVPGERIPSIRQFADDFGCNKLTVHRAFDILKQEDLIENRVGSGSYVRFPEKVSTNKGIYDFHTDYLDESHFPYQQIQTILNQLFTDEGAHTLAPAPAEGDAGLVRVLSRFYHVQARQMVIISGAQQGLDLVAKVFAANISDAMLFEDPTYPGALSLFKARHFVPLEEDGPHIDALEETLTRNAIRLFYTMPAVHNPTGRAYGQAKKNAIAELALRHGFFIIEDDFLSEFRHQSIPRFVDICPEQTIHIKSLSQTTVSGIRLGFLVVPPALYDKFVYAKFSSDIASSGLMQRCMAEFFKQGLYGAHLHKVEKTLAYRKKRLSDIIDSINHLSYSQDQAGFSLWVKSSKPLPPSPVPWTRGEDFSFSPQARDYFRLSFMHMSDAVFEDGVNYLEPLLA